MYSVYSTVPPSSFKRSLIHVLQYSTNWPSTASQYGVLNTLKYNKTTSYEKPEENFFL